jgi:type VI secretion system protein ImpJ
MTARSVYWQDGMLMWPHHMQQEERLHVERLHVQHRLNVHHNWGLRRLALDPEALKTGRLVVQHLEARLRDGTVIDVPGDGRPASFDLNEALLAHDEVTVCIALAKLQAHQPNAVSTSRNGAAPANDDTVADVETRFLVEEFATADENTGGDDEALTFRTLNLKLLPATHDLAGYDAVPVARFTKDAAANNAPRLDPLYIPPLLACDAWPVLAVGLLQAAYHRLGSRADSLAAKVMNRGITFESNNPGDNIVLGRLAALNEATTVLQTIAFTEGVHPLMAFVELCRLAGQLAVYSESRRAPRLPDYDHDNLGHCFYGVQRYLDELDIDIAPFAEADFAGIGLRMQVALQPQWLEPAWQMFVGVHSPLPQTEVIRLLTVAGQLDMKIGASTRVDEIFERGAPGLEFRHAAQPPPVLPSQPGLTYFQVNRDAQRTEWDHVQQSMALAIRVNQNRLHVGPAGNLQGMNALELKPQGPTAAATMRFTLFLVGSRPMDQG